MAVDAQTQTALANESRLQQVKQKVANLRGAADATASLSQKVTSMNNDTQIALQQALAEQASLEQGSGPGITADYGPKSTISQLLETERAAAKDAVIDYVKANPTCAEADAATAWTNAALASHPDIAYVIQDGMIMSKLYRANLLKAGKIPDDTWESQRQWIVVTDKAIIETT